MSSLKEYVDEWLDYQPDSGKFFWKKTAPQGTRQEGRETATINSNGYKLIKLKGVLYRAHRVAFLLMNGEFPLVVDHINRDRSDNKWDNLREASHQENCFNRSLDTRNRTGITGVFFYAAENAYTVTYGKRYIGRSKSLFEAACLRKSKENANQK